MPRVETKTKNKAGAERRCGRCQRPILPGDHYYSWSFRYGGTQYRCTDHYPRQSELTQSKMSEVYAAIEGAEADMELTTSVDDVKNLVASVADTVSEVADEYRQAAEPFGGQGPHAESADELESWHSELDGFDPDEPYDPTDKPAAVVAAVPDPDPDPVPDPAWDRYKVTEGLGGRGREWEREVYRHEFQQLGQQLVIIAYDRWWVDADGNPDTASGVERRVRFGHPTEGAKRDQFPWFVQQAHGGTDTGVGYTVPRDNRRGARIVPPTTPPSPRERLTPDDALSQARDAALELLGGCPL